MAIIKQYHKDTDTTYVYESVSYWDPEKKQARSKRKCIGKIDPETGEMIPTGKRGRKPKATAAPTDDTKLQEMTARYEQAAAEAGALKAEVSKLKNEITDLRRQNRKLHLTLEKAERILQQAR
ncbi:MAG: hypothetical protein Q4D71_10495 [Oscillospiraceae bacterium]|nr:hypothetical protein [Oscillospiraceae bacterium]